MSQDRPIELPYFDFLLEDFRQGNAEIIKCFGLHVHWGYWENPAAANGSVDDFAAAAEKLTQKVYQAGGATDGQHILDCGCGFGGTIASLNDRFSNVQLVGLNIDPRQIDRAREQVQPRDSNQIEFVRGDACQLPFADSSFDLVLAVECIFHFPSRQPFFQEAYRVLKPGGKLAICDFVPEQLLQPLIGIVSNFGNSIINNFFGYVDSSFTINDYRQLARNTGFTSVVEENITQNTIPTYPMLRQLQLQTGNSQLGNSAIIAEWVSRLEIIRYLILSYQKS
jgi:ubiquinone/menaquinone biosynthesis C-methylase UbiE